MSLAPELIAAFSILIVLSVGGVLAFILWRRRRQGAARRCPRCQTLFDPDTWKIRNVRMHYQGRYTITPAYLCPQCGFKLTPADILSQELKER